MDQSLEEISKNFYNALAQFFTKGIETDNSIEIHAIIDQSKTSIKEAQLAILKQIVLMNKQFILYSVRVVQVIDGIEKLHISVKGTFVESIN